MPIMRGRCGQSNTASGTFSSTWTGENLHGLESIFGGDPQKKFVRLLDFLPDDDPRHGKDVADPWYTGNFDATYRDVVAGCRGLLSKLEGER